MERDRQIIRTSIVGIVANVLLAGFKAAVGVLAGSIAIIMDAVNNLSDVLSSVITIVGTKLSAKPADAKHPFGHGRIEYFSAIVISIIVLFAGVTSLIESEKKIINPTEPTYTTATLTVIIIAIIVKILLGRYVKKRGETLQSDALIASGADALFDAVVTLSTLLSAAIMLLWHINLDGIFGTLISLVIIKAGVEMLGSPISQLIGRGVPLEIYHALKDEVMKYPEVHGVYDVILNYYGPNKIIGSLHINVLDTMTARGIHRLTREISEDIFRRFGIILTVGTYAINTQGIHAELEHKITNTVSKIPHVVDMHGFYYYENRNLVTLDVLSDTTIHDDKAFSDEIIRQLKAIFPNLDFNIIIDHIYLENK